MTIQYITLYNLWVIFKEDLELIFGKRVWDKELEEEIVPKPKKRAKKVVPPSDETESTNA